MNSLITFDDAPQGQSRWRLAWRQLRLWLSDRRRATAARNALCEHDGTTPFCTACCYRFW
jgi:hypothetical protein